MSLFSSPAGDMNRKRQRTGIPLLLSIFIQDFFHLVTLNAMFLVFSIPIVTMPAAYAAMTRINGYYAQEIACNQWKEFLRVFRAELFRLLPIGFVLLFVPAVLFYIAVQYIGSIWTVSSYLIVSVCLVAACLLLMMRYYFFPMVVWTKVTLLDALKNSLLFAAIRLFPNLLLLLVHLAGFGAALYYFPMSSPYLVLFYFSSLNLFATFLAWGGIQKHVLKEETSAISAAKE